MACLRSPGYARLPVATWWLPAAGEALFWALLGAVVLASYGVVAAPRPIPAFGRVYAAYGGAFVGARPALVDHRRGFRPDGYDILGAIAASCGMLVMVVPSRG